MSINIFLSVFEELHNVKTEREEFKIRGRRKRNLISVSDCRSRLFSDQTEILPS